MTWRRSTAAAVLFTLASAGPVLALATEHFGNAPVGPGLGLSADVLDLANLGSRVYWREVNGDPMFYYQGRTGDLNEALRKFAALGGKRKEVLFLPGPGEVRSLTGDRRMACDWYVHTPAGLSFARALQARGIAYPDAALTVYVPAARTPPADEKLVRRWLADLDSDAFDTREAASRELGKLGPAAGPALRKALARNPSAEVKRRLTQLLERLPGIDLDGVVVPAGATVVELKDLVARYGEGLQSDSHEARGLCVGQLAQPAKYDDAVVKRLVDVLRKDRHEYVRRYAASVLGYLGRRASAAVPVLKEGLEDPDKSVRSAFRQALDAIESSREEPGQAEKAAKHRAILEDIGKFRTSLAARPASGGGLHP